MADVASAQHGPAAVQQRLDARLLDKARLDRLRPHPLSPRTIATPLRLGPPAVRPA